jgi:hypothetical protein
MIDIMKVCDVSPVLPLIGILLSGLALLITLRLLLRLMTLETRQAVTQEIADIQSGDGGMTDDGELISDRPTAYRREVRRNGYRLMLLVPTVMLLLGCSTLLYMTKVDNCNAIYQGTDQDDGT